MDKTFRAVVSVYAFIGLALIALVLVSLRSQGSASRSAEWIDHTRATLSELDALLASLQRAEGAVRSYLFTEGEADRAAYRDAFNNLGEKVELTRAFVSTDPSQVATYAKLEELLVARADFARALLAEKQSGDEASLKQRLLEDDTGNEMFEIRRLAQQLRNHFTQLLAEHDRDVYEQDLHTRTLLLSVAALTFLALLGSGWFIRDDLKNRRQLANAAEQTQAELQTLVQERTQELETLNQRLKADSLEMRWRSEALDHQLRYSQRIIDSVSDLVFVVTKVGRISRVNPAVARLMGFDPAGLINRPIIEILHPTDTAEKPTQDRGDLISQAIRLGDELRDLAVEVTTKQQSTLSAKLRLSPLHDRDQIIGAVVTLRVEAGENTNSANDD